MAEEARFRAIFRRLHRDHAGCREDEWLMEPCRAGNGRPLDRPWVWSRRNGPWRRVELLWVGAAPGNAGGRGHGRLGAHGTRIPFGGDVAGANLEVLLGAVCTNRNETFIAAALNRLPDRGGGEPTLSELLAPAGRYPDSIELLRDTLIACGPDLVVALGNVAARALAAAWLCAETRRLPSLTSLERAGWVRGRAIRLDALGPAAEPMARAWIEAWAGAPPPIALRLMHPSAQNMSPFAGRDTAFHRRMLETRDALRSAVRRLRRQPLPAVRPPPPVTGIYDLPEWRDPILPRLAAMDGLWRNHGV